MRQPRHRLRLLLVALATLIAVTAQVPARAAAPAARGSRPGTATAATVPSAPTIGLVTRGIALVSVHWTAPVSDGGSRLTGYVITPYLGALPQAPHSYLTTGTNQWISGLTYGTSYTFKVAATNDVGTGPQSEASNAVVFAGEAGRPVFVSAVGSLHSATLSWTTPNSNCACPIDGYFVTWNSLGWPGSQTYFRSAATTETITGLHDGVLIRFWVSAVTRFGGGLRSAVPGFVLPPYASPDAFVARQVQAFLGRPATADEIAGEIGNLQAGGTPDAYIVALRRSPDALTNVDPTTRLYFAYFGRAPDAAGLTHWVARKRAGVSLTAISGAFATSSEFTKKYGSLTNQQFVELVYQNVLGRAGDPTGVAYWTGELDAGRRDRGVVMAGFSESNEYRARMAPSIDVAVTWIDMTGTSPSQASFDRWVTALTTGGKSLSTLAFVFLSTQP
ncbi:MAG: hypothetical protein JWN46_3949 [Acidimicrobiales bacterium]|nr:hypothetical protein [Acidimicrobiales bacterium]